MSRSLSIITIMLFAFSSFAQEEPKKLVMIEGNIMDSHQQPVAYAHILIPARLVGCVGDFYGNFSLGAYPGDTLTISAVSYHKKRFVIPDTLNHSGLTFSFTLEQDTVMLSEQVIYPWPESYEEFSKEFVQLETEDPLENFDLHLPSPQELKALANSSGGISMKGPFSLLYDRFSKEAKTKRAMQIIHAGEKVDLRYNSTVISIVTGLKDEEEIQKLVEFCDLQDRFILDSTDYELYSAIMVCYNEFVQIPK